MTTHKFTPGPWTTAHIGRQCTLKQYHNVYMPGSAGAAVYSMGCGPEEAEANARLIASAPDLLLALQQIDSSAAESVEWIRRVARAAIARATGAA